MTAHSLLYSTLFMVLFFLGVYKNVYIAMAVLFVFSTFSLFLLKKRWSPSGYFDLFLFLLFLLVISFSGGGFLLDRKQILMFLSLFVSGVALSQCQQKKLQFILMCVLPCVFVVQFVSYYALSVDESLWMGERLKLYIIHPNVLAALCIVPICAYLGFGKQRQNVFTFLTGLIIPCCIIVLTYARASLLGLFVVFFVYCILQKSRMTLFLMLIFLLGVSSIVIIEGRQAKRFVSAVTNPLEDSTFLSRVPIWMSAIEGFKENPFLGKSHNSFHGFHSEYIKKNYAGLKKTFPLVESGMYQAHNLYVGLLYSWGLFGCLLFFVIVLRSAWRSYKIDFLYGVLTIAFLFSQGFFEFILHRKDGAFIVFLPIGMSWGYTYLQKAQTFRT
ncbi:O-antigen ligase family protein [Desulfobaculum sp.]